jgi:hypothetical protein
LGLSSNPKGIGRPRQEEVRPLLEIARNERVVLVTFGSIRSKRRLRSPSIAGIHRLGGTNQAALAEHATNASKVDMDFIDLLTSCDGVVAKEAPFAPSGIRETVQTVAEIAGLSRTATGS